MTTSIFLIRHGEAEGNLYRRAQGHYDSNITALGRAQIAALAERFRSVPLDALWSSDLSRAQSTAAAIVKYHPSLVLHTTPRLREVDVGVWEDRPWGNLHRDFPEQMDLFSHDPAHWSISGSESYEALVRRIHDMVLELSAAYEGKAIAVVSHGMGIRAFLCHCLGLEFQAIPYGDNTAVALLEAEQDEIRVKWYNDNSHLPLSLSTTGRQEWWRREQEGAQAVYTCFEPLNPRKEQELYSRCYAETWKVSHGNLSGYSPTIYLLTAEEHARQDPQCLQKLLLDDVFAGLVELDPDRGREDGAGWISLLYIEPAMRNRRLGVQLIGHAVSYFRRGGRRSIRLHVSRTNENALAFYKHIGFEIIGQASGVGGLLYLMEMDISPRILTTTDL